MISSDDEYLGEFSGHVLDKLFVIGGVWIPNVPRQYQYFGLILRLNVMRQHFYRIFEHQFQVNITDILDSFGHGIGIVLGIYLCSLPMSTMKSILSQNRYSRYWTVGFLHMPDFISPNYTKYTVSSRINDNHHNIQSYCYNCYRYAHHFQHYILYHCCLILP